MSFKAGDKVAIWRGFESEPGVVEIDRLTPSGRIIIGSTTFEPDGHQRGAAGWRRDRIEPLTEKLRARAKRKLNLGYIRSTKWNDLDDETLAEIVALLPF